jgi:hypothetical protein
MLRKTPGGAFAELGRKMKQWAPETVESWEGMLMVMLIPH